MDGSVFQSINRFAARTGWAHGFMRFYANRGVVLFAVLLLVGYLLARSRSDLAGVASSLWAGAAALIALGDNSPELDSEYKVLRDAGDAFAVVVSLQLVTAERNLRELAETIERL